MNTKAKHTPGPWEVHEGDDYIVVMRGDETTDQGISVDNIEDACVVAAAPDLLAALERAKAAIEEAVMLSATNNGAEYSFKSTIEKISAALAKAKGEA